MCCRVINYMKLKTRNRIDEALFGFSRKNMEEILMIGFYFYFYFVFVFVLRHNGRAGRLSQCILFVPHIMYIIN
jgi:hypothetical protein